MFKVFKKTDKDPVNVSETLEKFWANKEAIKALVDENAELEKKIIEHCIDKKLFVGQTATIGLNKVSFTYRKKLVFPKKFDLDSFKEKYPTLCRVSVNEAKVIQMMEGADERTALSDEFDVEVGIYYSIKKA
jgi:hypothetical protein